MLITMMGDNEPNGDGSVLTLDNEMVNTPNFVDLMLAVGDKKMSVTISAEELFRAARVFEDIRLDRKEY